MKHLGRVQLKRLKSVTPKEQRESELTALLTGIAGISGVRIFEDKPLYSFALGME